MSSGTLAAHATKTVTVSLDTAAADALSIGTHFSLVQFSNEVSHAATTRPFAFEVVEPLAVVFQNDGYGNAVQKEWLQGPIGGPFKFLVWYGPMVMTNVGSVAVNWTATLPAPFTVSPASGTLAAHSSVVVTVGTDDAAALLSIGTYTNSMTISDHTSDGSLLRKVELTVLNDSYLTEASYSSGLFNLKNKRLTFVPDASAASYTVCTEPTTTFGTDASGGTPIEQDDSGYGFVRFRDAQEVHLTGGQTVSLFGVRSDHVWVHLGGYVDFENASGLWNTYPVDDHFQVACVSGFRTDLYDVVSEDASVSWKQLPDRFAVTWQNLETAIDGILGLDQKYTFQTELFFDGRIRITILDASTENVVAIVGLSAGGGTPSDFFSTDFSTLTDCGSVLLPLILSAAPPFTEGQGYRANAGQVSVPSRWMADVVVHLSSSDPSALTVPASVTIPAGASNAFFGFTIGDDSLLDGTQPVTITGRADGYTDGRAVVRINDNESTALHLVTPATLTEGGDTYFPHFYTTVPVADNVVVSLSAEPADQLGFGQTGPTAIIPPGQTSAVFQVHARDNHQIDGARPVKLIASVPNWVSATNTITVLDDENTDLTLETATFLLEGFGMASNAALASLSGTLATDLTVRVTCDNLAAVQPLGPVVIPAGQTNAHFNLFLTDNNVIDLLRFVTFTASAPGFANGQSASLLLDNDGPPTPTRPSPPDQADNVSLSVNLAWGPQEGELLQNGGFESLLANWTREDLGAGGWVSAPATYDPPGSEDSQAALGGMRYALSQQYGNGRHTLWQDITLPASIWPIAFSWSQRVHNHASRFDTNQQLRVELRDANNAVLLTLFTNRPTDSLVTDWTNYTVDLSWFRGQTVRLAFV
ncbi:MAG: hypothetical protein NT154_18645, partial [Verrucomicrobia bacterium]|nr:hypothetical protein [Verrucomicrobiota bacterium]